MNSSLAAILASPVSGVSGAVTGYPIGRGDGVSTVFAAPPEITAISALYRRDWQGNVALSASPRTNLFSYSTDFSNAFWVKSHISLGAYTTAPDGSETAPLMVEDSVNTQHLFNKGLAIVGSKQTLSIFAKASTRSQIVLQLGSASRYYNLLTGTTSGVGASIVAYPDGWYRCILTYSPVVGNTNTIYCIAVNGAPSYQGDGTSGIYIWGPQLENGDLTPYIPTTTAPVALTDYVASGTTLTLAEVPTLAAELTVDGTGVNLPLLQIGG